MIYSDELYVFNAESLKICWVSAQAARAVGHTRHALQERAIFEVFPTLTKARVADLLAALQNDPYSGLRQQNLQQGKNGTPSTVFLHLESFSDQGHRYVHARVEHVVAPDQVHEHQLHLTRFVMENVSVEVYWLDQYGHIYYANRQACQALGYSQAELLRLKVDDIDPLCPMSRWQRYWTSLKKEGSLFFETLHRAKDGRVFPVNVLANFLRIGEFEYSVAFARDISNRKQLEARLGSLVSVINVIIWSTNAEWEVDYVSPQIKDLLGLSPELFIGHKLLEIFRSERVHRDDRAALVAGVERLRQGEDAVRNIELRLENAQGAWQWLALNMSVVRDANGRVQQVVGSSHDISLQKQEEARLLDLNAELDIQVRQELAKNQKSDMLLQQQSRLVAMGEMIGNIAHQWRQPLNALAIILLNVEDALAHGEINTRDMQQALQRSQQILADMSRTIDDFRGFFNNNKLLMDIALGDLVKTNLRLLEASMVYHHIALTLLNGDCPARAMVHSGELSQVLLCLINNAKEQILANDVREGEITVRLEQTDDYAVIDICDNAGGIAEEHLSRVFDPYFTTKPEGLGLGLYISNLSIQQTMHGHIEVKNWQKGAKFSVFIPKLSTSGSVCR